MLGLFPCARANVLHALLALSFTACVPVASGPHGAFLDANGKPSDQAAQAARLKISARELTAMSSTYFAELEFTLENPTAQWVRIEKIGLDFGSAKNNQAVSLPWGSQLESWAEATHQRNVIREINDQIAIELIGAGLMLAAATSRSPAGLAAATGGMVALTAVSAASSGTGESALDADGRPRFNGRHLLALPLDVPPGLFLKRYLVVNTPYAPDLPCMSNLIMTYELSDKSSHRVAVTFRGPSSNVSEWQANVCPRNEQ